jgi:GTP cyclohydrolase I
MMSGAHVAQVTPLHVDGRLERGAEHPGIDRAGAEQVVRDLLVALGREMSQEGLRETRGA